jgi:hypothetical protein
LTDVHLQPPIAGCGLFFDIGNVRLLLASSLHGNGIVPIALFNLVMVGVAILMLQVKIPRGGGHLSRWPALAAVATAMIAFARYYAVCQRCSGSGHLPQCH